MVLNLTGAAWWFLPLGAIAIAAYTNVANFMDGINGISGMHGAVVGGIYALVGMFLNIHWLVTCGLLLAAAFVAFVPWNLLSRDGMFLGGGGSYLLDAAISTIALAALASGIPIVVVVGPLVVYIADVVSTLLRRISQGDRWDQAHRTHVYQRLTSSGWSHLQATSAVTGATVLTGGLGLLSLNSALIVPSVAAMGAIAATYLLLPASLTRLAKHRSSERT